MNKKVVWSPGAKRDLKEIKDFYDKRNKSTVYSNKLLKTFRDAADYIEKFPESSFKTDFDNVRGFVILDYIIFYEIMKHHILILTVWDCRRDPEQLSRIISER
jgi:addiction module RelE/StbE family toxin